MSTLKGNPNIVRPFHNSQQTPNSRNNGPKDHGKGGVSSPRPLPIEPSLKSNKRAGATRKITGSGSGDVHMQGQALAERLREIESRQESLELQRTTLERKEQDLEKRERELSESQKKVEAEQKRLKSLKRELEQHERALSERDAEWEAREQQKNAESEYGGGKQFTSSLHGSQMDGVRDLIRKIADICNQCQDESLI